jgi:death on curing protein
MKMPFGSWVGVDVRRLNPVEILALHDRIISRTGGRHGIKDLGALTAMVTRPFGGTSEGDFYPSLEEKAAALCHGLVREHPFADANHRTGVAAAAGLLELNGLALTAAPRELVRFARNVAGEHHRIEEMAAWFRRHTKPTGTTEGRSRQRSGKGA